ncbi:hypothetical protein DRA43_04610 [Micromonospora provocatoris]|nr:hypothetical protein DRA43_04610 [Micromonospora provocatoris]
MSVYRKVTVPSAAAGSTCRVVGSRLRSTSYSATFTISVRAVKVAVDPTTSPPLRVTDGLAPDTEMEMNRGCESVPSALRLCTYSACVLSLVAVQVRSAVPSTPAGRTVFSSGSLPLWSRVQ